MVKSECCASTRSSRNQTGIERRLGKFFWFVFLIFFEFFFLFRTEQKDAHEFLTHLMEGYNEHTKRVGNALCTDVRRCLGCNRTVTMENFETAMAIPLDQYTSLVDLFEFKSHPDSEQNCEDCGAIMGPHEVKSKWTAEGDYLLVNLKRYSYDVKTNRLTFDNRVKYTPLEFESKGKHWSLFGFVLKTGLSYHGGHYTTFFRKGSFLILYFFLILTFFSH